MPAPHDPDAQAAKSFIQWLHCRIEEDPLFLPGLRRGEFLPGQFHKRHTLWVAAFFEHAQLAGREEVYRGVARLYATYHRGPLRGDERRVEWGKGSMGTALARLTWTGGPLRPDRSQRYLDALMRRRTQRPWRELETICGVLRDHDVAPPDWSQLTVDLADWQRQSQPDHAPTVPQRWHADYYATSRDAVSQRQRRKRG